MVVMFATSVMNATKNAKQTTRPVENKNNRLHAIEASLVKSQVSEVAKPETSSEPAAKRQRPKAASYSKALTVIEAKINVGFGNSLFIRGQGAQLSWDKGLPLKCTDSSTWIWSTQ